MKKIYYITFLCLSLFTGLAQAPGYMGKRFVVGYGFYFSPALVGSNGKGNTILGTSAGHSNDGTLAFNSLHEGFVEYTTGKKFTVGFSARIYKSTYDNGTDVYVMDGPNSVLGYDSQQSSQTPLGLYHIKGLNFSLYGKLYFGKYIAPWGRYFIFGPTFKTYTCTYDPSEMKVPFQDTYGSGSLTYYSKFGPQEQKFKGFDIMAGFGRNRIVANRITLDYGFNVNLFALAATIFDSAGEGFFNDSQLTPSDYIATTAPRRVRGVNRFNAFLKVGVLLF